MTPPEALLHAYLLYKTGELARAHGVWEGDFNHATQTISFAALDSAIKTVSVPITDDNIAELSETFTALNPSVR